MASITGKQCGICGDERPYYAKGFCKLHYSRNWRGDTNITRPKDPPGSYKDGRRKHPLYITWAGMHQRCRNPNTKNYGRYGGRGITICKRWFDFANFLADMGMKPTPAHTLDRIDSNGNYEPGNVRWALPIHQTHNRRTLTTNKSGIQGVTFHEKARGNKWIAYVQYGTFSRRKTFATKQEAIAAKELWEKERKNV